MAACRVLRWSLPEPQDRAQGATVPGDEGYDVATLPAGTIVDLSEFAAEALRFLPPDGDLVVVVHPSALRAPHDRHTQVAHVEAGEPTWLGALGEDLLVPVSAPPDPAARSACAARLLRGSRLWDVVRPGALLQPDVRGPLSTVYAGSDLRPWVVIGETDGGEPIAVPLNDATNPKWWTPVVRRTALRFPGNLKDAQVELAHAWTLPAGVAGVGDLLPVGTREVEAAIRAYFGA